MSSALFDPLKAMSKITREVLVGFSGGKDSCVTLDLCVKNFDRVVPFFMYQIPNMSFQIKTIKFYERKYGLEMIQIPHFETSNFLRYGTYREPDYSVPIVSVLEMYEYLRIKTGIYWIAAGERIADSIVRRAMIKHSGSIDFKRGRFYPLAYWGKADVLNYIRVKKLYLGSESKKLGCSFRDLSGKTLLMLKKNFPDDYEKAKKIYPLCEAAVKRETAYGGQSLSEL